MYRARVYTRHAGSMAKPAKGSKTAGDRLRLSIENANVKQADLARGIGVSTQQIQRYLNGENSMEAKALAIGAHLGINPEWLMGLSDDEADPVRAVVEDFIREDGPNLKPRLSMAEATFLRSWPHRSVTRGRLLDAILDTRKGLSEEQAADSDAITNAAREAGERLGVPKRRAR